MEVVLSGLARERCMIYLDDVLVVGRTLEEHNANLAEVLKRIRAAGLKLKPRNCNFAQTEVTYLRHVVSASRVRTDPENIKAVSSPHLPTSKLYGHSCYLSRTIDVLYQDSPRRLEPCVH